MAKGSGSVYEGSFHCDTKIGSGVLTRRRGAIVIEANFVGKPHGPGTVRYDRRTQVKGRFVKGRLDGPSVVRTSGGQTIPVEWSRGVLGAFPDLDRWTEEPSRSGHCRCCGEPCRQGIRRRAIPEHIKRKTVLASERQYGKDGGLRRGVRLCGEWCRVRFRSALKRGTALRR